MSYPSQQPSGQYPSPTCLGRVGPGYGTGWARPPTILLLSALSLPGDLAPGDDEVGCWRGQHREGCRAVVGAVVYWASVCRAILGTALGCAVQPPGAIRAALPIAPEW